MAAQIHICRKEKSIETDKYKNLSFFLTLISLKDN